MTVINYKPNFGSIVPVLRARETILTDLPVAGTANATEISKSKSAEIEVHIKDGDERYQKDGYCAALEKFKKARALIYKALYPGFNVHALVAARKDIVLPTSEIIEKQLMEVSLRIVEGIRPKAPTGGSLEHA